MKNKNSPNSKEIISTTAKKPMRIKAELVNSNLAIDESKLSKRELKALKWANALKQISETVKKPKFDVKEYSKQVFQRTIDSFKGFSYTPDGRIESYGMDACEIEAARTAFAPQLSYEILAKYRQTFIGWQNCAVLKQNPIIDKACSIPPEDAMSTGYKLAYAENGKRAKIGELEDFVERSQSEYGIRDICVLAATNTRVFGWSLVIPTFSTDVNMEEEFDIDKIEKGTYKGMTVVEPYWITYDFDQASLVDPTSRFFYQPTWYSFPTSSGYKRIHRSWCIKLINSKVSDVLKPTYFFGGVPLTQQIYEAEYAYEKSLNEALLLMLTKRSYVADAEMSNYMANPQEVNALLEATSEIHDNYGIWVKQIGSEVKQMDTALNGLEEVVGACMQRVAAIAEMPVEKLFKLSIKGLNSSGSFEQNDYKQLLIRFQKDKYTPIVNRHNMLMSKSETGKVKKFITEFNPVDTPDELTKAKIREIEARTLAMRLGSKVTNTEEERIRMIADPNSGFSTLDPKPPVIDEKQETSFSVEKDNLGRPLPKAIDNPIRAKSKEDIAIKQQAEAKEQEEK